MIQFGEKQILITIGSLENHCNNDWLSIRESIKIAAHRKKSTFPFQWKFRFRLFCALISLYFPKDNLDTVINWCVEFGASRWMIFFIAFASYLFFKKKQNKMLSSFMQCAECPKCRSFHVHFLALTNSWLSALNMYSPIELLLFCLSLKRFLVFWTCKLK